MTDKENSSPEQQPHYVSPGVIEALMKSGITFSFAGLEKVLDAHEKDVRHNIGEQLRISNETARQLMEMTVRNKPQMADYAAGYLEGRRHARLITLNEEDHAADMSLEQFIEKESNEGNNEGNEGNAGKDDKKDA